MMEKSNVVNHSELWAMVDDAVSRDVLENVVPHFGEMHKDEDLHNDEL